MFKRGAWRAGDEGDRGTVSALRRTTGSVWASAGKRTRWPCWCTRDDGLLSSLRLGLRQSDDYALGQG